MGIICDIQRAVNRLVSKAPQLAKKMVVKITAKYTHATGNFRTNLAEIWMHIRSKFDGGKQINRVQSNSWQARCAGAAT